MSTGTDAEPTKRELFLSSEQEMELLWTWFREWSTLKRRQFLDSIVPRVVPNKLFSQMTQLSISKEVNKQWDHCSTFDDQLAFAHQCLDRWTADQANYFTTALEDIDQSAVYEFYHKIAATVREV